MTHPPVDPISEYKQWKQHGESLRSQARQAMEVRFRDLLTEAAQIAIDYQTDFGGALKPPPQVTAFRVKPVTKGKSAKAPAATPDSKKADAAAPPANPKVVALEKKVAAAKKKLEATKLAGGSTKILEDKVYELEDELRLAIANA